MVLPNTCRSTSRGRTLRGFSFIEVLVVLALASTLGGLALFVSMDTYRGTGFRTDRDILVGVLQHARSLAMNNICTAGSCTDGKPHGVHIQSDAYIIFEGTTYNPLDTNNMRFDANTAYTHSGYLASNDVVFEQLSGKTSCTTCDFATTDTAGHVSTTTVSSEGQIIWTH